jgi:hypothetical protein
LAKAFRIARDGAIAEWARVAAWVCYYLAMVGLPIGCGLKAVALGQDVNYDSLNYHLYDAWAFLNGRSFSDLFPAGSQSLIDPFIDVPTYLLQAHTSPHVAAFTIGFEQGIGPVLTMVIVCRMMKSPMLAILAGLTAAIAGGFASELGNDMGDSLLAPVFALAVLFALNAIRSRHSAPAVASDADRARGRFRLRLKLEYRWWLASGLVAGAGGGLKFAQLPITIGVIVGAAVVVGPLRLRASRLLVTSLGGLIGLALTAGQWTIELWQHYGDPFAFVAGPLLGFADPYFVQGTPATAGVVTSLPVRIIQSLWAPVEAFFHPLNYSELPVKEASLAIATAMLFLLVIVALISLVAHLVRRGRLPRRRVQTVAVTYDDAAATDFDWLMITVLIVSVLVWAHYLGIYRYLIPLEVLAPVLIISIFRRVAALVRAPRIREDLRRKVLPLFFIAVCIFSIVTSAPSGYWDRAPFAGTWSSIATPKMLENGKTNVLVGLSSPGSPSAFLLTLLKGHFIAVGGVTGQSSNDMLTPATVKLLYATFAKVRKEGGSVIGYWRNEPTAEGALNLINAIDPYKERMGSCISEYMTVGAYLQVVTFCRFVPALPAKVSKPRSDFERS